ncbi:MAG: response regulator [Pyrinomonadaceae bacterium]
MDREGFRSFIRTAEAALISVRGSLLLISQGGAKFDLAPLAAQLGNIAEIADPIGLSALVAQAANCKRIISEAANADKAYLALDAIALVEAALLAIVLPDEIGDVGEFVDGSFDELLHKSSTPDASPHFTIDEETLEIFRAEGEELLASISLGIDMLAASPGDQNALWDIRRCAHTFKGAAGIVGLSEASSLAHRMEDLLDRLVESSGSASDPVIDFLRGCVRSLGAVLDGHPANAAGLELAYSTAVESIGGEVPTSEPQTPTSDKTSEKAGEHRPVMRMSLDRLAEIVALTEGLLSDQTLTLETRAVAAEIHERLLKIRLISFGTLETRLARAVSVTASEERKKAVFEIETPDVEIDTLILDALVEPLLHVIKNAVVHGVEFPEVRRMLGKHEFGLVSIRVEADSQAVVVTVSDDGAGIDVDKVKQKAVERRVISDQAAAAMSERETYKLLFDKGLTTAENVTLNAGRGVGMSIVKDAIELRGGSIHVASRPQLGTTLTLMLPVQLSASKPHLPVPPAAHRGSAASSPSPLHTQTLSPSPFTPLILIVEDSASVRRHTQMIVDEAGLRSITARDGAEALELLLNGTIEPDLILSDVEMPHLDGWQLLDYLKTDPNLGSIPVVMVTSLDGDDHRALAAKLGAADYIVKPFSANDIERVLTLAGEGVPCR